MNNKELEKILKEKLNQNSATNESADWDVFSKILQNSEGFEDFDFDEKVSDKVNTHKVVFNENHWQLLKDRLLKEEKIRKTLFSTKALEVIILLLLLFSFQNYESNKFKNSYNPSFPVVVEHTNNVLNSIAFANSLNLGNTDKQSIINSKNDLTAFHNFPIANVQSEKYDAFVDHDAIKNSALDLIAESNNINLLDLQVNNKLVCNSNKNIKLLYPIDANRLSKKEEEEVGPMSILLKNDFKKLPINFNIDAQLPNIISPFTSKSKKYVTATVSGGLGIVHSGFDPIYKIAGYSAYSSQFGIGLLYSIKKQNIEIQSGLRYTKKKYEPNKLTERYGDLFNGYKSITLDKISYDIVDIPLSIKYFFKEGKKTSLFVKAGVNINFSLANNFLVSNTKSTSYTNVASQEAISDSKELDNASRLSQKDFNPGLLQKDLSRRSVFTSIDNNSFLTLSGEIGLERKLSVNNALVFGAEYNKYYKIDGIGPNKDKLSALTINLGIKHSL